MKTRHTKMHSKTASVFCFLILNILFRKKQNRNQTKHKQTNNKAWSSALPAIISLQLSLIRYNGVIFLICLPAFSVHNAFSGEWSMIIICNPPFLLDTLLGINVTCQSDRKLFFFAWYCNLKFILKISFMAICQSRGPSKRW